MLRMLARDRKVTVFTREGGRERVKMYAICLPPAKEWLTPVALPSSPSLSHWLKTTIGKQKLSLNFFSQFDSSQFVFLSFSHSISISLLIMNGLSLDSWEC